MKNIIVVTEFIQHREAFDSLICIHFVCHQLWGRWRGKHFWNVLLFKVIFLIVMIIFVWFQTICGQTYFISFIHNNAKDLFVRPLFENSEKNEENIWGGSFEHLKLCNIDRRCGKYLLVLGKEGIKNVWIKNEVFFISCGTQSKTFQKKKGGYIFGRRMRGGE